MTSTSTQNWTNGTTGRRRYTAQYRRDIINGYSDDMTLTKYSEVTEVPLATLSNWMAKKKRPPKRPYGCATNGTTTTWGAKRIRELEAANNMLRAIVDYYITTYETK